MAIFTFQRSQIPAVFSRLSIGLAIVWLAACSSDPTIQELEEANPETVSEAAARKAPIPNQITFTQPSLYPEGVVLDQRNKRFLVSSVTRGTIGAVSYDGTYTPFIEDTRLTATLGLTIDNVRKRVLVAVSNPAQGNLAALGIYDLRTGNPLQFVNLGQVSQTTANFANDIALDPFGNAYVTNSFSPVIYRVKPNGEASVFFRDSSFTTAPGQFGFNGIAYDNRGFLLVAFSKNNAIIRIPVRNPSAHSVVQLNAPLANPDGLLLSKDGKQLIVVNNAGGSDAGRVLSFVSTDRWSSGKLSDTFPTGAVFPTTATSDGKNVFVLYAYLNRRSSATPQNTFTIQKVGIDNCRPF